MVSWDASLVCTHRHAGSSPARSAVRTGPLACLRTLPFSVLSRQCLNMQVHDGEFET